MNSISSTTDASIINASIDALHSEAAETPTDTSEAAQLAAITGLVASYATLVDAIVDDIAARVTSVASEPRSPAALDAMSQICARFTDAGIRTSRTFLSLQRTIAAVHGQEG